MDGLPLTRRATLQGGAALLIGFHWLGGNRALAAESKAPFAPNAFVRIGSDDRITIIAKHLEMGQGTYTGLATILAEELDADWAKVQVEGAPADASRYANLHWGPVQGTGGSSAMANSWMQLRQAGASARAALLAAAAKQWQLPVGELKTEAGQVLHPASGRKARYGELAALASTLEIDLKAPLKDPKQFRLIGQQQLPRKDMADKVSGRAIYTQDVRLPGMLTAVVAHAPRFGGKLKSFDASAARKVKGVVDVVQIPTGVAVLGNGFWAAKKGRDLLKLEWNDSGAMQQGSAELLSEYRALLDKPGAMAKQSGDLAQGKQAAKRSLASEFVFPYLAHASMEPLNCVIRQNADGVEMWNGEQSHTSDQAALATVFNLKPEQVKINMLYAGGSFGRRANPHADYVLECAQIVKAISGRAPVKLVWTREDDLRAGYYRPLFVHKIEAGITEDGKPAFWQHRLVGQSLTREAFGAEPKNGIDNMSLEGAANQPYSIGNFQIDLHSPRNGVPILWWRSVGHTHTAFAVEVMIDQLAEAAGQDPIAYRLALLDKKPRLAAVLQLVAERAGWNQPLPPSSKGKRGRGVAVVESFRSVAAEVVEVTIDAAQRIHVDRVVCAIDCGIAINPDNIRAQMEGGIGFALSAALHSAITLKQGAVEQSNFHDYPQLRMAEMPKVEVHIVPSANPPTGVGEPGVPPLAPALANAIANATGRRLTELPLKLV